MGLAEAIILAVLAASTPLLLAAAGELVAERAGVLNLGVEGMMIMGAACGFAGAYVTGSTFVGALCGLMAGAALSAVFAMLTLGLAVDQVATGLALTILGIGLSGLIGAGFVGEKIVPAPQLHLPVLTDLPLPWPSSCSGRMRSFICRWRLRPGSGGLSTARAGGS